MPARSDDGIIYHAVNSHNTTFSGLGRTRDRRVRLLFLGSDGRRVNERLARGAGQDARTARSLAYRLDVEVNNLRAFADAPADMAPAHRGTWRVEMLTTWPFG